MPSPERRFRIATLLWLLVPAALMLAATRGSTAPGAIVVGLLTGYLAVAIPQTIFLVVATLLTQRMFQRGERTRARRWLEGILSVPAVAGSWAKRYPRMWLMQLHASEGRLDDAVAVGRAMLGRNARKGLFQITAGGEVTWRDTMADWLDALGRPEEAATERARADACLAEAAGSPEGVCARADRLLRAHRYTEASKLLESRLGAIPAAQAIQKHNYLARLMNAASFSGRLRDMLRWADVYLRGEPKPNATARTSIEVWQTTVVTRLGALAEAEQRARATLGHARDQRPSALALLGWVVLRLGRLDEAQEILDEAVALTPIGSPLTIPRFYRALLSAVRGQTDEAITPLRKLLESVSPFNPVEQINERRWIAIPLAELEAESGQADRAWERLQAAGHGQATDPVNGPRWEAAAALVLAHRGDREAALAHLARGAARRDEPTEDLTAKLAVLATLGRAALALGEPVRAEEFLRAALDLGPDPVDRPALLLGLGQALRLRGDEAGAQAAWREAVADGHGTAAARRSADLLTGVGVSPL